MVLYIVTLLKVTWHWFSDTVVYDLLKAGYKSVIWFNIFNDESEERNCGQSLSNSFTIEYVVRIHLI